MNKLLYLLLSIVTIVLFFIDLNPPVEKDISYEEVIEGTVEEISNSATAKPSLQ